MLSGFEHLEYQNASPDTLHFIWIHLWPNAYKGRQSEFSRQLVKQGNFKFYFSSLKDRGYIDSLDFRSEGLPLKVISDPENPDMVKLILSMPLLPGAVLQIQTPFRVKIPSSSFSRLGHDGQSYYISQWYPKPAVYDLSGWHPLPYLDQGEFYSEFGDFDVRISLPENYVLAATGERFEAGEENAFLEKKFLATQSLIDSGATSKSLSRIGKTPSSKQYKTVRFKQDRVHDFAFFADKDFHVMKGEIVLPHTKNKVTSWTFFTSQNFDEWKHALTYIQDAVQYYSLWNGDYLYSNVSAVDGKIAAGGGMEYPMISLIGETNSPFLLDLIIAHEVGHNWFYGMLGSNERKNPWMDEGINSFNELRYIKTKYPKASLADMIGIDSLRWNFLKLRNFKQDQSYWFLYALEACSGLDQADNLSAERYTELNYGAIVYSKTALVFNYLMNYMGENDFDLAMKFYFEQWSLKHPKPEDLRKILEFFCHKDLGWFFDGLLGSSKVLDYKILSQKKLGDGSFEVRVKNIGGIASPLPLCAIDNQTIKSMVWFDGFKGKKKLFFPPGEFTKFKIDYFNFMPETQRQNNAVKKRGLFPRVEKIHFPFLFAIDNAHETQIFYTPIVAYNMYNGPMVGLAIYNHTVLEKKLETELMPMFAFGNMTFSGSGNIRYHLHPRKSFLTGITLQLSASRYAAEKNIFVNNYSKLSPSLQFQFRSKHPENGIASNLEYRFVQISREITAYSIQDPGGGQAIINYGIHELQFNFKRSTSLLPFDGNANFQSGNDMQKVSLTFKQKLYISKTHFIECRAFAGAFLYFNPTANPLVDYRFRLSGWNGANDYLYDYSFFGRNEGYGLAANQMVETNGGMKAYSSLGQSTKWIVAANLKSPRIFKLPFLFFGDFGTSASDGFAPGQSMVVWDAGIDIVLFRDILEVFVPLAMSQNMIQVNQLNNPGGIDFWHQIRFTFNIRNANPFKVAKNLLPL